MSSAPAVLRGTKAAWQAPAAEGAAGPRRRDIVLVSVLVLWAVLEGTLRADLDWPLATTVITLALLPCLLWRRTHPLLTVLASTLVSAGFEILQRLSGHGPNALVVMFAFVLLPYALFRWGSGRARIIGGAAVLLGMLQSVVMGAGGLSGLAAGVAFLGGACLVGVIRRDRVEARARELAHARLREREALARDLHDTVAHRVSAIAIRAQAAAVPEQRSLTLESLAAIEVEAQAALSEMRSLVGALRTVADYAPSPGLQAVAELAVPGPPPVRVRIEVAQELSGVVASTVFRIAQEAVTNARKHALYPTVVDVEVSADEQRVRVEITDDGAPVRTAPGSGYGLRGIVERAALSGGDCEAGPIPGGGWRVGACLPLEGKT